ncbi:hypothetical protein ACX8XP_04560 [Calditrichota bacterium LG25]
MTEELKKRFQALERQISELKMEVGTLREELSELTGQFFNLRSVYGTIMQSSRISELLIEKIAQDANYRFHSEKFINRIDELSKKGIIPNEVVGTGFHSIRIFANKLRHYKEKTEITYYDAETILRHLFRIIEWYYSEFSYGPRLSYSDASNRISQKVDVKIKRITDEWIKSSRPYPEYISKDLLIELERLERLPKLPKDAFYLLLMSAIHNGHNWIYWFEKAKHLPETALYLVKVIDEGFMRPQYRAGYCLQKLTEKKRNKAILKYYNNPQPPLYLKKFYQMINDGMILDALKEELFTSDGSKRDKIRILIREFKSLLNKRSG